MGRLAEIQARIDNASTPTSAELDTIEAYKKIIQGLLLYLGDEARQIEVGDAKPGTYKVDEYAILDRNGAVSTTIGIELKSFVSDFSVCVRRMPTRLTDEYGELTWEVSVPKFNIIVEMYRDPGSRLNRLCESVGNNIEAKAMVNARRTKA